MIAGGDANCRSTAVTAYAGLAPMPRESGRTVRGHPAIGHAGNRHLRTALSMATRSAGRHNPAIKPFYNRLRTAGKPMKVARCAAACGDDAERRRVRPWPGRVGRRGRRTGHQPPESGPASSLGGRGCHTLGAWALSGCGRLLATASGEGAGRGAPAQRPAEERRDGGADLRIVGALAGRGWYPGRSSGPVVRAGRPPPGQAVVRISCGRANGHQAVVFPTPGQLARKTAGNPRTSRASGTRPAGERVRVRLLGPLSRTQHGRAPPWVGGPTAAL